MFIVDELGWASSSILASVLILGERLWQGVSGSIVVVTPLCRTLRSSQPSRISAEVSQEGVSSSVSVWLFSFVAVWMAMSRAS